MRAGEERDTLPVGVLGGGALGLAAALRLAEAGEQVTVIERESHLGGLAAGFTVGQSDLEKFYHHIFTTDRTIIALIGEMGLEDRLVWKKPTTSLLWHGQIADLGGPLDFLRLPFLPFRDRIRWVMSLVALKLAPNEQPFVGKTALDWTRRMTGPRVSEVIWEPLLRGKFGERAADIAMPWLWSRFHERSLRLGYLRGGFQQFYDAIGERIRSEGGMVLTGHPATALRTEDGIVVVEMEGGQSLRFKQVLVTLPSRLFARLTPELPEDFVARFPGPEHYGAHVVILALDRPLTDHVYWLNVNDRDLPFLAVVEHTHFMPPEDYGGRHLVYLGNYLPMDHPLFTQDDDETVRQFCAAIPRIQPAFDSSWITERWVFKAPFAQPIATTRYLDTLPPHRTPVPNVYLANMAHVYPQDRGQNYSLALGQEMATLLLTDRANPARLR